MNSLKDVVTTVIRYNRQQKNFVVKQVAREGPEEADKENEQAVDVEIGMSAKKYLIEDDDPKTHQPVFCELPGEGRRADLHLKSDEGFLNIKSTTGQYRYKMVTIDFLTKYTTAKLVENKLKSGFNQEDEMKVSAIDQDRYAQRFIDFMIDNY